MDIHIIITRYDKDKTSSYAFYFFLAAAATREEEECFMEWSEWGRCSRTCGGGRQARVRHLYEVVGRVNCVGDLTEIQECNQDPCAGNTHS